MKSTMHLANVNYYCCEVKIRTSLLQYVCSAWAEKAMAPHSSSLAWKNPMDGGAWWAAVHGVTRSQT